MVLTLEQNFRAGKKINTATLGILTALLITATNDSHSLQNKTLKLVINCVALTIKYILEQYHGVDMYYTVIYSIK